MILCLHLGALRTFQKEKCTLMVLIIFNEAQSIHVLYLTDGKTRVYETGKENGQRNLGSYRLTGTGFIVNGVFSAT